MNDNLISIQNLSYRRDDRVIFDDIDIDIPKGKITAIMGPSGSGKTTLLKLIGAELYPNKGDIYFNGQNVHRLSKRALFNARIQMGILFQSGALFTNLNVFENVAFPLREHTNLPEPIIHDVVLMKLHSVGLRGARNLMPQELSGGMARRVAFARATVLDPMLMMYDEPFTGQDPISMGVLINLIVRLNQTLNTTSIIVSHDVAETLEIADVVYIINKGKILACGTPDEIKQSSSEAVRQFIEGRADGSVPFHYPAASFEEELMNV